ncbi:MAG: hypothetical protein HRU27_00300 [Rhizobiaceae bacterium]|nr:hypothetical protein [Hyphomicrobiales bacterium]NRB29015.1 hypothetical protein [Rhizobiaceae bacterium]
MAKSNVEKVEALLKSIETGETDAVAIVDEANYIQHNPQTHEGSEGLATLFKRLSKTEPKVNMVRGFEDDDYVFAHMEYDFSSRKICFEVFRFEGGRAVEHWDNIQARTGPNDSGHSMVDGATQATDLDATEANRERARQFVETVLIGKAYEQLGAFINAQDYTEHNPRLGDDIALLAAELQRQSSEGPVIDYQRLHRVLAQGSFVLCVSEGRLDGAHTAFYDLFRLADGMIVEHWDTTETVAPKADWKNNNGKF